MCHSFIDCRLAVNLNEDSLETLVDCFSIVICFALQPLEVEEGFHLIETWNFEHPKGAQ